MVLNYRPIPDIIEGALQMSLSGHLDAVAEKQRRHIDDTWRDVDK